jgi:hypothetical protein
MLEQRILATIHFFDVQNIPLTSLELYKYLLTTPERLIEFSSSQTDQLGDEGLSHQAPISFDTVLVAVDNLVNNGQLASKYGFYCLAEREQLILQRWRNHYFGLRRERRIRKFLSFLSLIPFIRGLALNGSQALGQEQENSDIDLFIITDPSFLWLARNFITGFFRILGVHRHGRYIKNRFCLNHYLAGVKIIHQGRNLYTALEYAKLRPLVPREAIENFQEKNISWVGYFFPHINRFNQPQNHPEFTPWIKKTLELVFKNSIGIKLEKFLEHNQIKRVKQGKYIRVEADELSFHPDSKEQALLEKFFAKLKTLE